MSYTPKYLHEDSWPVPLTQQAEQATECVLLLLVNIISSLGKWLASKTDRKDESFSQARITRMATEKIVHTLGASRH